MVGLHKLRTHIVLGDDGLRSQGKKCEIYMRSVSCYLTIYHRDLTFHIIIGLNKYNWFWVQLVKGQSQKGKKCEIIFH